jgi:exopolyphosphatase / guanosine-5'-triphosphate,3'-diphosphate pyrophosphatase
MSRYAAIDIGSNSIRLLAAEVQPDAPMQVLASDRQVVRLGSGVFREGKLTQSSMDLACQVLQRMVQQYSNLDIAAMRAVGTAALRDASNRDEFLGRASEILKRPVEVISGLEEARLVHLGVQSQWPHPKQRILLVDIGGGSAELILSEAGRMVEAFSKPLGAVRLTELYLKSDPPDQRELARMEKYVQERLVSPASRFGGKKVDRLIGTSSTMAAVVSAVNRVRRSRRDEADRLRATSAQVRRLYREVSSLDEEGRKRVTGIGPRRAEIIVAGVAVVHLVLDALRLPSLYYSSAGVRDGVIADLAHGKMGHEHSRMDADQRRMVRALMRKYGISAPHVVKVSELANILFDELRHLHKLPLARGRLLEAAAHLYNIGHFVNEARHHRHSMYLVMNSDLPGFSDQERLVIANLCRYHRKSMPGPSHEAFHALSPEDRRVVLLLAPLLRLAVALDQSQEQRVQRLETVVEENRVELRLHSDHDLDIEQWHAEAAAQIFQQVYELPLTIKARR